MVNEYEEPESTEKEWYESKGMWGGVVTLIASVAGVAGYTLSVDEIESLTFLVTSIATGIGGLLALYGRRTATKTIK